MDYGAMLNDAFSYAKDGIWGNARRWFLLLVSLIIFPFILGYVVRIYRGETPAPELERWGTLFVDGLKLLAVQLVYAAPVILLIILAFLPFFSTLLSSGLISSSGVAMSEDQAAQLFESHPEIVSSFAMMIGLFIIALLLALIIGIFSFLGAVRFARTGRMSEAFNFSAILAMIRRIGWINYLIALIVIGVMAMVYSFVMNLVMMIPVVGIVIWFFLYPPFLIFVSRYTALVYDAAEQPPAAAPPVT